MSSLATYRALLAVLVAALLTWVFIRGIPFAPQMVYQTSCLTMPREGDKSSSNSFHRKNLAHTNPRRNLVASAGILWSQMDTRYRTTSESHCQQQHLVDSGVSFLISW